MQRPSYIGQQMDLIEQHGFQRNTVFVAPNFVVEARYQRSSVRKLHRNAAIVNVEGHLRKASSFMFRENQLPEDLHNQRKKTATWLCRLSNPRVRCIKCDKVSVVYAAE